MSRDSRQLEQMHMAGTVDCCFHWNIEMLATYYSKIIIVALQLL